MKIGMIGTGIVGGATMELLKKAHEIFPYDKYKEFCNSENNFDELVENSEVIFICVPTPMKANGNNF